MALHDDVGRASAAPRGLGWGELALLALCFAAVRAWVVLALGDVFFYGEELEKGAAGKALLEGLGIPRHQLAYHYYEGGGFVTSHLDALAFWSMGPSLLALKLVALTWSTAALVLAARFLAGWFGRGAGLVFGLLFTFAPEGLQQASLLNLGIHFQALIFVPLMLASALRIAFRDARSYGAWMTLGLASGFGTYYSYQCAAVAVFALLLVALVRPVAFRARASHQGWIGFLFGILPFLWMATQVGSRVFDVHGQDLLAGDGAERFAFVRPFFRSLVEGRAPLAVAGTFLLPAALLAALCLGGALARAGQLARGPWLALAGFCVFEVGVYAASGFAIGAVEHTFQWGRLSFVWWAALAVLAPVLAAGLVHGRAAVRAAAGLALAALVAHGALAAARLATAGAEVGPRRALELLSSSRGYSYPQYFGKLAEHLSGKPAQKLAVFLRTRDPERAQVARAAALALTDVFHQGGFGPGELEELFRAQDVPDWREFLPGLAGYLRYRTGNADPAERLRALEEWPPELRPYLAEAVSRLGWRIRPDAQALELELAIEVAPEWLERWDRGLGARLCEWKRLDPWGAEASSQSAPRRARRSPRAMRSRCASSACPRARARPEPGAGARGAAVR